MGRTYSCWMLNCWCITWPVGFKRLSKKSNTEYFTTHHEFLNNFYILLLYLLFNTQIFICSVYIPLLSKSCTIYVASVIPFSTLTYIFKWRSFIPICSNKRPVKVFKIKGHYEVLGLFQAKNLYCGFCMTVYWIIDTNTSVLISDAYSW